MRAQAVSTRSTAPKNARRCGGSSTGRGTTATAPDRHTKFYPNYLGRIAPQDRNLVLPSLMNTLGLVGTRDDLLARSAALEQAGIGELLIQPVVDPPTEMAQLAKLLN